MPETDEIPRTKSTVPVASVNADGSIVFRPRSIIVLLALLGLTTGGSSILAKWGLVTESELSTVKAEESKRAEVDDTRHDSLVARVDGHDKQFEGITATIGEVQKVQHWSVADQAATRVSKTAPKPHRNSAYRRLLQANLERLKAGNRPCSNLECTN